MTNAILAYHYQSGNEDRMKDLFTQNLQFVCGSELFSKRWLFEIGPAKADLKSMSESVWDVKFKPALAEPILEFPFADKVIAAAEAERLAVKSEPSTLVWLDADTLFIQKPLELLLETGKKAAITPVHLKNISHSFDQPLDDFWQRVYAHCKVPEERLFAISSSVDREEIYPHFNAGLISVDPAAGILRQWCDNFLSLYRDPEMEVFYQKDIRYKIFIHQAVLAGTILSICRDDEIKWLPPTYNFPLHLVSRMEDQLKPASLNQLVTVRYDDYDHPGWESALKVEEPLKTWLQKALGKNLP